MCIFTSTAAAFKRASTQIHVQLELDYQCLYTVGKRKMPFTITHQGYEQLSDI